MKLVYESDLEKLLISRCASCGALCIKVGYDGWPDRVVILPGCPQPIWVELKREDGKLSEMQKWRKKQLESVGQRVVIPYSKRDVIDMFPREV